MDAYLHNLNFFFDGDNDNLLNACNLIGLNEDNNEFVSFLCSDMGQNILTNNSLSIHVERGNIFYDNFSTNENFYNFLLAQQDETKWFIPKRISYHRSFERYMKQFLPAFSLEESDKYDFLTNKSSNYLLYKFSDWIELLNAEKIKIRHSSVVKNDVGLIGIEKKTTSFWQKKLSAILKKITLHDTYKEKTRNYARNWKRG